MKNTIKEAKIKNSLLWIYILCSSVYFTQGIEGIPGLALFFYLKEHLHFNESTIMYIGSLTGIAWVIKPFWGFIIDQFLTKKTWMIVSLIGSLSLCLYLGLSSYLPLFLLITILVLANWNSAMRDVAVDGIMCVDGKETDTCDKIQAIQWTAITIASIIVGLAGGYIADNFDYKLGYLALIPIYLIILTIVLNYKTKKSTRKEECCGSCNFELDCAGNKNNICDKYIEARTRPPFLLTILDYRELFTNKSFLFSCLFLFLYKFSPGFGTPLSFIQRDVFKWSGTFMGVLGAIISCFEIVGAIVFFKYCKKINIKKWLIISTFIGAIASLCYLYFTPVTAIAYGIIFAIVGMFVHLIVMSFMAKATLAGKEATSFALLCSISNLAGTASGLAGAYLFPKIGLQSLIIISAITSFVCLPLINKLEIK